MNTILRIYRMRVMLTVAATVAFTAIGILVGALVGRVVTLVDAQEALDQYALRVRNEADTSATESRSMLSKIGAATYAPCSTSEIDFYRKLVFHSEFLKEAGRIKDGRIQCSALLGGLAQPSTEYKPDFVRPDGSKIYRNLEPFRIGSETVVTVEVGEAFVVYSPFTLGRLGSPSMHFTLTDISNVKQADGHVTGDLAPTHADILRKPGRGRVGDTLYATRCSARYFDCVTAYSSTSEVMATSHPEMISFLLVGAMAGAIKGLLGAMYFFRRKGLEQQLRRAIGRGEIELVYQPIVELSSGRIVGAEALARWSDEDLHVISPEVFIRIAEERGFVGDITKLVVSRVLSDFGEILRISSEFRININVAAADLADVNFVSMVERCLKGASVSAERIALEITESTTARHQLAMDTILSLRATGHCVYIDDFGTGYSSLSYLHDLSIDGIKIDKSFTQAVGTEAVTVAILPQILAMAEALKLHVIVEGIETVEQAHYFAALPSPALGQGWYFGHPMAASKFHLLLTENWNAASHPSAALVD